MTIHVPAQQPRQVPTKIAFIGEAPSDEELEKGVPLVGPSGRVFNQMMQTANLDRADYLITNVFDEKLPDNDVARWCAPMREAKAGGFADLPPIGAAGYLKPEYRWHLDRLQKEIDHANPTVLVPLGATALWALTGSTQITSYRGTVLSGTRVGADRKLLPTFHPAHVMHQWKFFTIVVGDFMKAARQAELGPKIILPERQLLIEPTLEEVRGIQSQLLASDLLSVDIETGWGQLTSIGFAPSSNTAICIPFTDRRKPNKSYWETPEEEVEVMQIVKRVLESPVPKLGQNYAGYDFVWLYKKYGMATRNLIHDTRLMHHALYPELPKSLEFMAASYTNQGAWKRWGKATEKRDD